GETPWAENTVRAPSGTSLTSSTNTAPRSVSRSTTCLLWTICLRTYTGGPCKSSARSTVCTARSTPAQYPRGAASKSFSTVLATTPIVGVPATLDGDGTASPRQAHRRGCVLPASGGTELAHARRRPDDRGGSSAHDGGVPRADPQAPAPGAALSPQAGIHGARQRASRVG